MRGSKKKIGSIVSNNKLSVVLYLYLPLTTPKQFFVEIS